MAQWGRNDQAVTANSSTTKESSNGAPIGTYALVNGGSTSNVATIYAAHTPNGHFGNTSSGSRASIDSAMFGNTTINAFRQDQAIGIFGVDTTEMGVNNGTTSGIYRITGGGSGYAANAAVTLTFANSYSNVSAANTTQTGGRITALTSNVAITGITGAAPALTIAAPAAINITANSTSFANGAVAGASNSSFIIASANTLFLAGDRLYYSVPAANTPVAPLTGNTYYYVSFANSTVIKLATTATGANIAITDTRVLGAAETHTFRGDTATGLVIIASAKRLATHAGWVLRTEGTGGRAGRVQYETLIAMGSLGAQTSPSGTAALVADASDDIILPDA